MQLIELQKNLKMSDKKRAFDSRFEKKTFARTVHKLLFINPPSARCRHNLPTCSAISSWHPIWKINTHLWLLPLWGRCLSRIQLSLVLTTEQWSVIRNFLDEYLSKCAYLDVRLETPTDQIFTPVVKECLIYYLSSSIAFVNSHQGFRKSCNVSSRRRGKSREFAGLVAFTHTICQLDLRSHWRDRSS